MKSILTLAIFAMVLPEGYAETSVKIPVNPQSGIEPAPDCAYPCYEPLLLPGFVRAVANAGPEGRYETQLSRSAFRSQLEDWRSHMEIFRRSIELKRQAAEDRRSAHVDYLVNVGLYRRFVEAYRLATDMDKAGQITYNAAN